MSRERIGKVERWILTRCYLKTVKGELPYDWIYPRYHPEEDMGYSYVIEHRYEQSQGDEPSYKEIDSRMLSKPEVLLNYFKLEISDRNPRFKDDPEMGAQLRILDEKFRTDKKYKSALASYSRTIKGLKAKNLVVTDAHREDDCNAVDRCILAMDKKYMVSSLMETIRLTDSGRAKAETLLNVNT